MSVIDIYEQIEQEQKVAEYYAAIGRVMRRTWKFEQLDVYLRKFVEQIREEFDWQLTAVFVKQGDRLELSAYVLNEHAHEPKTSIRIDEPYGSPSDILIDVLQKQEECRSTEPIRSFPMLHPAEGDVQYLAYPLINREIMIGVLLLGRIDGEFDDCETDILRDLAEHITLAMDNIKLYEERERYTIAEERSRLAKDLHDSVNQKLFSMSLIAQGLVETTIDGEPMREGLQEIGQLAQESLAEMKSLIWDLRMSGEEKDLKSRIEDYAGRLGLQVRIKIQDHLTLSERFAAVFWRVSQEALNNIRKHAHTQQATIEIREKDQFIHLIIIDQGCGFSVDTVTPSGSFGLTSMRERVRSVQGTLHILSGEGRGTTIHAIVPAIPAEEEADDD